MNWCIKALCIVALAILFIPIYDQTVPIEAHGDDVEIVVDSGAFTYDFNVKSEHTHLPLTRAGLYADMYRFCQPDTCIQSMVEKIKSKAMVEGKPLVKEFMRICHGIQYVSDSDAHGRGEYWQLPCETLLLGTGDCEDIALLFISMCKAAGFDCIIIKEPNHISAGVKLGCDGKSVEYNGERYLAIDPTNGYFGSRAPDVMFIMDDVWELRHTAFFLLIGIFIAFIIVAMFRF